MFTFLLMAMTASAAATPAEPPLRLAIVGLVHGHARGFLDRLKGRADVELVGIAEKDAAVLDAYRERFDIPRERVHPSVERLLEAARPEAVAIFTSTFDHPAVVEACAARGIHVMMEKPLAVSVEQARRIAEASARGRIHVLVNYETTWYPATSPPAAPFAKARSARYAGWWPTTAIAGRRRSASSPSSWAGSPIPSSTAEGR